MRKRAIVDDGTSARTADHVPPPPGISCTRVGKVYPSGTRALDDVTLSVSPGEIVGLLGPNGAGKTTLVRIIVTLLLPSTGEITVGGFDAISQARQVRRSLGIVLSGDRGLYGRLSGRDNLEYFAVLGRVTRRERGKRIPFLLERVDLTDVADKPVEEYSAGMKQRLHIARSLVTNPDVLIMDEPTSALDPIAAMEVRQLILSLRDERKTILLTTHLMSEAEIVCGQVAVLKSGRILATGSPRDLCRGDQDLVVSEFFLDRPVVDIEKQLSSMPGVHGVETRNVDGYQQVSVFLQSGASGQEEMRATARLLDATGFGIRQPTLEEAYVRLVLGASD